jgi:hypothetical protein
MAQAAEFSRSTGSNNSFRITFTRASYASIAKNNIDKNSIFAYVIIGFTLVFLNICVYCMWKHCIGEVAEETPGFY